MAERRATAILISGRGSNMTALIEAAAADDFPARIVLVLSNRPDAAGLERARNAGIAAEALDHTGFDSREAFEEALTARLQQAGVDLICLAGFMRLLTDGFVKRWQERMINIHPSLLPAFKGVNTHTRALQAGVKIAGCSVHFVTAEMDGGPIIAQAAVPVRQADTPDSLAARVLEAEHRLYPAALRLVASGRARVVGERVEIEGDDIADGMLLAPSIAGTP